jgi:hypothetical protein
MQSTNEQKRAQSADAFVEIIERLEEKESKRKQQVATILWQVDNRKKSASATNIDVLLSILVGQAKNLQSKAKLSGRLQARLRKLQQQIGVLEEEREADKTALFLLLFCHNCK